MLNVVDLLLLLKVFVELFIKDNWTFLFASPVKLSLRSDSILFLRFNNVMSDWKAFDDWALLCSRFPQNLVIVILHSVWPIRYRFPFDVFFVALPAFRQSQVGVCQHIPRLQRIRLLGDLTSSQAVEGCLVGQPVELWLWIDWLWIEVGLRLGWRCYRVKRLLYVWLRNWICWRQFVLCEQFALGIVVLRYIEVFVGFEWSDDVGHIRNRSIN